MKFLSLLFFCVLLSLKTVQICCQCSVNVNNDYHAFSPIIYEQNDFIYPGNRFTHIFEKAQQIQLICPGKDNFIIIKTTKYRGPVTINCENNNEFSMKNLKFRFKELRCESQLSHQLIVQRNSKVCPKNNDYVETGFRVNEKIFLKVIQICFDHIHKRPTFSFVKIYPNNKFKQYLINSDYAQVFNDQGVHKDTNSVFLLHYQKEWFVKLFGTKQHYVSDNQFLERGHLSAKADLFYNSQQNATFYFVNVIPMWRTINSGNWLAVEKSVRNLAVNKQKKLLVWTGSAANLQLQNKHIFLKRMHPAADKNFHVTVPRFLFKLIHEPTQNRAVVIVTINNPYWEFSRKDILCQNNLKELKWLSGLNTNSHLLGYTYACTYGEFKQVYPDLPNLPPKVQLLL